MSNAFAETRNCFASYIDYTHPLSYEEWLCAPDDHKAAILYVQFYEEITLAWYKCKSLYTPEERGVEEMMTYLMKNTPIIMENPKRFTSNYIYRVAYNCLYCICHDIQRDKERFALERSNILAVGDDEIDLFDTTGELEGLDSVWESRIASSAFWKLFEDDDEATFMVINKLLGADCPVAILDDNGKVARRINKVEQAQIMEVIRSRLEPVRKRYGY